MTSIHFFLIELIFVDKNFYFYVFNKMSYSHFFFFNMERQSSSGFIEDHDIAIVMFLDFRF